MSRTARFNVRGWSPTPEQVQYLRATEATSRFLQDLPDDVRQQFAGQWIAAKDNQILASAATMAELCDKLGTDHDPTVLMLRIEKGVTIRCRRPL